jgi:hypothetical protein
MGVALQIVKRQRWPSAIDPHDHKGTAAGGGGFQQQSF